MSDENVYAIQFFLSIPQQCFSAFNKPKNKMEAKETCTLEMRYKTSWLQLPSWSVGYWADIKIYQVSMKSMTFGVEMEAVWLKSENVSAIHPAIVAWFYILVILKKTNIHTSDIL